MHREFVVERIHGRPYHPQNQGSIERAHQAVKPRVWHGRFTKGLDPNNCSLEDAEDILQAVISTYNHERHATTKCVTDKLFYGRTTTSVNAPPSLCCQIVDRTLLQEEHQQLITTAHKNMVVAGAKSVARAIPATISTNDIALATLATPGEVEDFEVEAILGFRGDAGQLRQYLVKWTRWPPSASTWEPRTNFNFPIEDIEERIPDLSSYTDTAISTLLKATNSAVLDPKAPTKPSKGSKPHPFVPIAPPRLLASNLRIDFQSLMATSLVHISAQDRAAFEDEFRRYANTYV
ncbi:hypothetical protein HDU93_002593 [Gonapodya sp. JEL0774]|nr:hypothetical protein HDU93_002593 [Gonapodya sp. JEL0774]